MERAAILYIATGPYKIFWYEFFASFERRFLTGIEKDYYVFTDDPSFFKPHERVHVIPAEDLPWPLVTLLRFRLFLSLRDKLRSYDWVIFANANLCCNEEVGPKEILPRREACERLFFAIHGGYAYCAEQNRPYERNPASQACVPLGEGGATPYVMGGFYGGLVDAFLEMAEELEKAVEADLRKNLIAVWHDESHVNRYVIGRSDVRLLDPSYMYDEAGSWDAEANRITILRKDRYLDIDSRKRSS